MSNLILNPATPDRLSIWKSRVYFFAIVLLFAPLSGIADEVQGDGSISSELASLRSDVFQLNQSGKIEEAELRLRSFENGSLFNYSAGSIEVAFVQALRARLLTTRGLYGEALAILSRSLDVYKKSLPDTHEEIEITLNSIALNHLLLGSYRQALNFQRRALGMREVRLGATHLGTATYINDLAAIYWNLGEYEEALQLQLKVLRIREDQLPRIHPHIAHALINIAHTYKELDGADKALRAQARALEIYEESLGTDAIDTARAYNNIAQTYRDLAQFETALRMQRRSLSIYERILGANHPETGAILNNLSSILTDLAQYDEAQSTQIRALDILQASLGAAHPDTLGSINNLALIYSRVGLQDKAHELRYRVVNGTRLAFGEYHPRTALAISNLSKSLNEHGRPLDALALQKQALEIFNANPYWTGAEYWTTVLWMGESHYLLGNLEEAANLIGRVLAAFTSMHQSDQLSVAQAARFLGQVLLDLKEPEAASAILKIAVNANQSMRSEVARIGASELQTFTGAISHDYQKLAEVLTDHGRLAEAQLVLDMLKEDEQFDFIRRSSSADPRRTRIGYTPTEERWMSRYREIADRLAALGREEQALQKQAKLGLSEEQKKRQTAVAADLKVAQAAFESFLGQMRQEFATKGPARSVEFAESSVKALAELQGLLKSLGDDVVLLQIYLTDEQVNFLLTTPGVQLARNVKIKTQDLNRLVAELNRLLRDPKSDPLPAAQALYKLLLAPVEQDLQQAGAKTVMLSLDGVLRYLPFGVLHDGERYALQRWNLPIYTSVVRERLRDAANPNWQAAGLGVTRRHGDFDPLPAVRAEMSSIIRTGTSGVLPGEVHLDEAFTAQRLKDVSQRRFPVVHVASHFRFSPGTEANSFLLLGDGTQLTLGNMRTQNYRFDDVDLLTLSACETGLGGGRDQRGREIEGFGVIAQQQGAKAVLATLWKVADSSTATLMGDMYRRRTQSGLSKIEALRRAQIALASQPRTSHPFYWAPFVLMGNWK